MISRFRENSEVATSFTQIIVIPFLFFDSGGSTRIQPLGLMAINFGINLISTTGYHPKKRLKVEAGWWYTYPSETY